MATLNTRRSSSDGPRLYCKATWLRGVSPDPRRSSAHAHRRERQSWRRSRPRLERELSEPSFKIADFGKFFLLILSVRKNRPEMTIALLSLSGRLPQRSA